MGWAELVTVVVVFVISASLARRVPMGARIALWTSALLVSAGMFMPSSTLSALLGRSIVAALSSGMRTSLWSLEAVAHFTSFLWLALALWTLRPDLRGWKAVAALAALAIGAELMQGLTVDRTARLDDVGVNLLGAGVGLVFAIAAVGFCRRVRAARVSDSAG